MNKTTRRISMLLVLTMVLGLFAAFPAMNAFAADTNYAKGIVPTIYLDEAGTTAATAQSGTTAIITDGIYETSEVHYYFGSTNTYYVNFDLGSVKTDVSSVYLYMRTTGNRAYPASVKVFVSTDGAAYTEVETISTLDTTTTANYTYGNYKFKSAKSARYVRIAMLAGNYVTSFAEIEIRNYGLAAEGETQTTADPTLVEGNYAYGATYTVAKGEAAPSYWTAATTDSGNWLTDGYEGPLTGSTGSPNYTVVYTGSNAVYVITLTLTSAKTDMGYVTLVNVPAPAGSFTDPASVAIATSSDGLTYTAVSNVSSATTAKNGGVAFDHTYTFNAAKGQYVQLTITGGTGYLLGFDEIVIGGTGATPSVDADPTISCGTNVITSATETNYALSSNGAYYAYGNYFPNNASYADDTWTRAAEALNKFGQGQLNDGAEATDSYTDVAWVGFVLATTADVEIIFDLAHLYGDIDQIAFTTLAHGNDTAAYEKVEKITVSFGDINGTYGNAVLVGGLVTENTYTSETGKSVTRYTSQFAVDGPATGARYVKIAIPKATYRLFIDEIKILGASGFDYSADLSVEQPSVDQPSVDEPSVDEPSVDDSKTEYDEERGSFNPNATYVNAPSFRADLSAEYGEFDTNGDGVVDFTGIAVTISAVDITYEYGIYGIEGFLNFDNTYLTPLYVVDEDLNGDGSIFQTPKPVLTWPTVDYTFMGTTYTLPCVEGLSQSYSMADGSTTDPSNPAQTFSKTYSRMVYRYIMHTDYFTGYDKTSDHMGTTADNAMQLRYYFSVAEGQEGKTFTFTVPDSPEATHIANAKLYAPAYDANAPQGLQSLYGKGDEVTVTIPEAVKEYTVTFVGKDGATLKTETVVEGGAATAPEAPVVDGFTFKGWDKAFDNITGDLTVTALYEEIPVASYDFFTFAEGAVTTGFTVDETNGYLKINTGVKTAAEIKAIFANPDVTITTATGSAVADTANASTTRVLTSTINGESKSIIIVTLGDVNGDGKINASDYGQAKAHANGSTTLTGAKFVAANVVAANTAMINAIDYGKIKSFANGNVNKF